MSKQAIVQQVRGILAGNNVPLSVREDGEEFFAPAPGEDVSTGVFINFVGDGDAVLVTLRSPVLADVKVSGKDKTRLLELLNDLNCGGYLVKYTYYEDPGIISLEYDLLGNELQESELMSALSYVAATADEADDTLQKELGVGKRFLGDENPIA